jgi:ATP:ADP antiporter, AAA family
MSLLSIRKGERRDAWAAFATLFVLIASHSLLETARDALFLGSVPATRLPWAFLATTALSLAVVRVQLRLTAQLNPRKALSLLTALAGLVTLGFFALYRDLGALSVYALYCWSGVIATCLLTHFWGLVGGLFTITQAKRLYGMIGAGSVLGAIFGSGLASLFSRALGAEQLLCLSAVGFLLAATVPWVFKAECLRRSSEGAEPEFKDMLAYVVHEPYASRVVLSLFLGSACLTVADFVFKSSAAALVPTAQLGTFFGSVSFAVNVLSLVCQLGIVGWFLRRASPGAALSLLPLLLAGTGLGVAIFGGLAAVLAVKAADGTLRHSLHRTATELLFLPFADDARRYVKAFVDVAGQRGGQALAALAILAFTASSASPRLVALLLVALAAAWAATAVALRRPYIELFRTRLKAGRLARLDEFPELDLASLESLTAALESENDQEVLGALRILEREGKSRFIPALILHHPSEQVVLCALAILTQSGRRNLDKVLARMTEHPSPQVRAASMAAQSVLSPDAAGLRQRLELEASPEVRAAILVNLSAAGELTEPERLRQLEALLEHGTAGALIALAKAIELRRASGFLPALLTLSHAKEFEVRRAALTAMCEVCSVADGDSERAGLVLSTLVQALAEEATRPLALRLLAMRGEPAFSELAARLEDRTSDTRLRWRLPRAMGECNPGRATSALLAWLPRESDGSVRYQIVRELERLLRLDPTLSVDRSALQQALAETASRAFRCLDRRLALMRGAAVDGRRKTQGHALLVALMRDKELNATGRLFRLLGVAYPNEDFAQIYRGLGATRELRATSLELIESVVREPLRSAVLALVDDSEDELRLARAGRYHRPQAKEYELLLVELVASRSESVRELARFHVQELERSTSAKNGQAA